MSYRADTYSSEQRTECSHSLFGILCTIVTVPFSVIVSLLRSLIEKIANSADPGRPPLRCVAHSFPHIEYPFLPCILHCRSQ
jgi:hypothetical protein